MPIAYVALGFGLGVLFAALLALVALAVVGVVAWRGAVAFERAGFELHVKGPGDA